MLLSEGDPSTRAREGRALSGAGGRPDARSNVALNAKGDGGQLGGNGVRRGKKEGTALGKRRAVAARYRRGPGRGTRGRRRDAARADGDRTQRG